MEDKQIYQEFLNGDKEALNILFEKYRSNLIYFISRYTKNMEASEDIFQEVALYILEKKEVYNPKYSFKTYLYTVAKSRAINYVKKEKNFADIDDFTNTYADTQLLEEIIFNKERKDKIQQVIGKLKTDYQLVLYLTSIEELSYKETALIMEKTVSQIKTLAHNAKKKLKEELKNEGVVEMKNNKLVRVLLTIMIVVIGISGLAYGAVKIYEKYQNANLNPTFTGTAGNADGNNVWVGTFQIVWNELMDKLGTEKIEFVDGESKLASELNKRSFTKDELSEKDYYIATGAISSTLKTNIEKELKARFNETSEVLERINWKETKDHYLIYAMLKKEFTFKVPFPKRGTGTFGESTEKVKYFGLDDSTMEETFENVEALFYNSNKDFAVKIKTVEGEELLLYRTDSTKSFDEIYSELLSKTENYNGKRNLEREKDRMKIPFIKVKTEINYDELCHRYIKGTNNAYIEQAIQTVDFELDNYGGHVKSEALIDMYCSISDEEEREFNFTDNFVLFMKEEGKDNPYFALKVDNTDILVEDENAREIETNTTEIMEID